MSRIYFHSEHDDAAEVRGSERYLGSGFGRDIALHALDLGEPDSFSWNKALAALIQPKLPEDLRHALTSLKVDGDKYEFVLPDGSRHGVWGTLMNTTLALGSPPVQLMVRLHAQCEIHAWVAGEDRAWLADVIEEGRASGVMRARSGWEEVVALLRSRSAGEVVTSYSVTEPFPNARHAGRPCSSDADDEAWYALPTAERWKLGVAALRASTGELQITPDNLGDPTFFGRTTTRTNGLKIMEMLSERAFQEQAEKLAAIKARGELPSIYDL